MAIDGIKATKVQKSQQIPVAEAPRVTRESAQARLESALKNRILSEDEVGKLAADLKELSPADRAAVLARLVADLRGAQAKGQPIRIQDAALDGLKKIPGLAPKALHDIERARDKTVTRDVRQGLEAKASTADETNSSAHREQTAKNVLERQKAARASQGKGKEAFSLEGRSQDAALALLSHFDARLSEHLPDEVKALREAMGPEIKEISAAVLREMSPEAKAALGAARDALLSGDGKALKEAVGTSFSGVIDATGSVLKLGEGNPEAMEALLGATKGVVERLPQQWQAGGQRVVGEMSKLFAKLAPKAATEAAQAGAVATQAAGTVAQTGAVVAQTAQVAQTGAAVAEVGAAAVQSGAAAAQAGAQAAKVGATAASAGAKAIPGVNIAVGAVATGFAAMEFIGECRRQPKSWARLLTSGLNTIAQAVGVVIPGVGAVATLAKFGGDAVIGAHEKKTQGAALGSAAPDLSALAPTHKEYGSLGGDFFQAMGYEDAARSTRALGASAENLAGVDPQQWSRMTPEARDALYQQLAAAHSEVDKLKDDPELKNDPKRAAVILLGDGFKKLLGALRKARNADTDEARADVTAAAMEATAKAAAAKEIGERV